MSKSYYGRKWTVSLYTNGHGSKTFGPLLYHNSQRAGLELYFWVWNLTILREHH